MDVNHLAVMVSGFISQGDFGFPSQIIQYLDKNFFSWSSLNGAANLDGIVRVPGRLLTTLVYFLFGSVGASYFYLFSSFAIVAVSGFLFLKYFLRVKSKYSLFALTFMFTLSPAFLGNTAKIGLVAAAALLLLCLLLIKIFFDKNKLIYLLLLVVCLNYSLIHPYTFTLNLVTSMIYLLYRLIKIKNIVDRKIYIKNICLAIFIGIILNSYFILPFLKVGTIDKAALSQDTVSEQVDYSGIIDISNAGSPTNALTLAKHAFIDFDYYNSWSMYIYVASGMAIIFLAIILYLKYKSKMSYKHLMIFYVSLVLFLVLIFMSSGYDIANQFIKILINLPAGWIFRSPLKWQLYAPLALMTLLAIITFYMKPKTRKIIMSILLALVLLQSAYISYQIYNKLLVPKSIGEFSKLANLEVNQKLLYVSGTNCSNYLNSHPNYNAEINQILNSSQLSIRRIAIKNVSSIQLSEFKYIFTCDDAQIDKSLFPEFNLSTKFADGNFSLFKNNGYKQVEDITQLFYKNTETDVNQQAAFVKNIGLKYNTTTDKKYKDSGIEPLFAGIDAGDVHDNIVNSAKPIATGVIKATSDIFYVEDNGVTKLYKSGTSNPSAKKVGTIKPINSQVEFVNNSKITNTISNGSFEDGTWTKSVQDCYNFDSDPKISMGLKSENGSKFIRLSSGNHIACTSQTIAVSDKSDILLGLKYRANYKNGGGYTIAYNDPDRTVYSSDFTGGQIDKWNDVSILISVPSGATSASLKLYTNPNNGSKGIAYSDFDEVTTYAVPAELAEYYIFNNPDFYVKFGTADTKELYINPTSKKINISNMTGKNVLIKTGIPYDKNWDVSIGNDAALNGVTKIPINNNELGLIIDYDTICGASSVCGQKSNDLTISLNYSPQKYFLIGSAISCVAIISLFSIYIFRKNRKNL